MSRHRSLVGGVVYRAFVLLSCAMGVAMPASAHAAPNGRDVATPAYASSGGYDVHVHVRRGDSLEYILAMKGLGPAESAPWVYAARGVYDLRKVRPKRGFTLQFDRTSGELKAVRYEIDNRTLLTLERRQDGLIDARREALPYFVQTRAIAGRIDQGLKSDTAAAGLPEQLVSELVDIFGWDMDVGANLSPGDEFRIIYEAMWEPGKAAPMGGKILGAQIVSRGYPFTAVLFERSDGSGGYYRPDGQAWSRDFLRYPVEFREISSEFSGSRYHPILHRWRPHRGVDLAAPRGTPVRAAADGWVKDARFMGGLGRAVRLEHAGDRVTTYGHLNEIAPGIAPGSQVERGQVIGYVGATGHATGPHLHYEVEQAGVNLDPMQFEAQRDQPVSPPVRREFEKVRVAVTTQLAKLPVTARPSAVSLSSVADTFRAE